VLTAVAAVGDDLLTENTLVGVFERLLDGDDAPLVLAPVAVEVAREHALQLGVGVPGSVLMASMDFQARRSAAVVAPQKYSGLAMSGRSAVVPKAC
jgi:hypothetical protein